MKNFKSLFLALIALKCSQIALGMEQPPQPPKDSQKLPTYMSVIEPKTAYFQKLPPDVKRLLLPYVAKDYPARVAKGLFTFATTDKKYHALINDVNFILTALNGFPYVANGVDLIERLQAKRTSLPVLQNPLIIRWLGNAKASLRNGEQLYSAIEDNHLGLLKMSLEDRLVDLNWRKKTNENSTALMIAMSKRKPPIFTMLLLNAGANPDIGNDLNDYPIIKAAHKERTDLVSALIQAGVNPNIKRRNNYTALIYSLRDSNRDILEILLKAGAHVNFHTVTSATPLMIAAQNSTIEIVEQLLNANADPDLKDTQGLTARDYAAKRKNADIVLLLDEASAKRKEQTVFGCNIS